MTQRKRIVIAVLAAVLLLAAIAAGMLYAHSLGPDELKEQPGCWLYRLTGLYCAGCGDTRAAYYIAHGHLYQGFRMNPLAVIAAPFIVATLLLFLYRWARLKPLPNLPLWAVWTIISIVIGYMVLRNLPWEPFRWLAPTQLPWVQ